MATKATGLHNDRARCWVTNVTGRCVASGAVATTAGEEQDDNQQDQEEGDDLNTFTQRGTPVVDSRSGATPVSPPVSR